MCSNCIRAYVTIPAVGIMALICSINNALAQDAGPTAHAFPVEKLPPGYVRGEVVSYSYVPNRLWGRAESIGILPYLFEYGLMAHKDGTSLEQFHEENIRRIDMAARWSTVIQLYPRRMEYRDEIINLMIRCFKHRQLIAFSDYYGPGSPDALERTTAILDKLWENRETILTSPEGDQATGRQLINNILLVKIGDEEFPTIKTEGLANMQRIFDDKIKNRRIDGQRPFAHIKSWYNEVHCGFKSFAIDQQDVDQGRGKLPANIDFFGVDVYHWWGFGSSPFDPDNPSVTTEKIKEHAVWWQNVITRYYGPDFRVTRGDPWIAEHKNDTHALMQAIDLAGADQAMMIFIGTSDYLKERSYTTPIEVMDAYYDSLKAGPWVGLSWWIFDEFKEDIGTLAYLDKKLIHYTPDNEKGSPYSAERLESYRQRFIASRMRMFKDVVYNQFGYLNGPAPESNSH